MRFVEKLRSLSEFLESIQAKLLLELYVLYMEVSLQSQVVLQLEVPAPIHQTGRQVLHVLMVELLHLF